MRKDEKRGTAGRGEEKKGRGKKESESLLSVFNFTVDLEGGGKKGKEGGDNDLVSQIRPFS